MDMPAPGAPHKILHKLAGSYVGDEVMYPSPWSPEKQNRKCTIQARSLDGFFVISDYEQTMDDKVTFRGHGVYSFDPQADEYKMYWFDSMGGAGGVASGFYEGNQLTFQNTSPMGHHRYRYTFEADHTRFEMAMSQDGEEWQTMMDGRYRPAE